MSRSRTTSSRSKRDLYAANFGDEDFVLADVRRHPRRGRARRRHRDGLVPVHRPSLAGNRAGLRGEESSMFWEFARVLREMEEARPAVACSRTCRAAPRRMAAKTSAPPIGALNDLGYCVRPARRGRAAFRPAEPPAALHRRLDGAASGGGGLAAASDSARRGSSTSSRSIPS